MDVPATAPSLMEKLRAWEARLEVELGKARSRLSQTQAELQLAELLAPTDAPPSIDELMSRLLQFQVPRLAQPSDQQDRFASATRPAGAKCEYVFAMQRPFDMQLSAWFADCAEGDVLELFGPKGAGKSHSLLRFAVRLWLQHFRGETLQERKLRVVYVPCLFTNPSQALKSALLMAYHDDPDAQLVIRRHFEYNNPPTLSRLFERPGEVVVLLLDQVFQSQKSR
jgi:hypothetical protein